METPSEIYICTDQPTTCPKCGTRTDMLLEELIKTELTQLHKCLFKYCGFIFLIQDDKQSRIG